jgi:hypothetical protein
MTSSGIDVEVTWRDEDVLLMDVSASNGVFAGRVQAYGALEMAAEWAAALEGFPRNRDDCREVSTGTFSDEYAGGGATLRFVVRDAAGHCAVQMRLRAADMIRSTASAEFTIAVEAAAVDRFVAELRAMSTEIGQRAELLGFSETE